MKNIHLLPTDKPSRLWINNLLKGKLELNEEALPYNTSQHIYITSDDEIKEGDYWIYICPINGLDYGDNNNPIVKNNLPFTWFEKLHDKENYKKIILTTDADLIKDGVQAIDDEFLESFVKNPSCMDVEVADLWKEGTSSTHDSYQIIIPKEEPKQETLEEAAEKYLQKWRLLNNIHLSNVIHAERCKNDFTAGAKWMRDKITNTKEK